MPDLTDDLRALLAARAAGVEPVAAPATAVVRRVRRRRAARVTAASTAVAAGLAGVVGIASAGLRDERAVPPAAPAPSPSGTDDRYEFCPPPAMRQLEVAVHRTERKFARGCYSVSVGTMDVLFLNPQTVPHNVAIYSEDDVQLFVGDIVPAEWSNAVSARGRLDRPLAPGDYKLVCQVHPEMYAQLVVR